MGLHLPPKSTLHGAPVSSIQKAVRKFGWTEEDADDGRLLWSFTMQGDPSLEALIDAGGAKPSPGRNDRGGYPVYELTEIGSALMSARLRKRTLLKNADAAWLELKDGVAALNTTNLVEVSEVWIFGSYMRRAAEIGDIDAVIFTDWVVPDFDSLTRGVLRAFEGETWPKRAMKRMYMGGRTPAEEMTHILIFGGRRKPIFDSVRLSSFAWQASSELRAGMPAQRVFTRSGGWNYEEPVRMHPSAHDPTDRPYSVLRIDQGEFSALNDSEEEGPLRS